MEIEAGETECIRA